MNNIVFLEILTFTEWYHYAFLFLWLLLLFYGLSKFYLIETLFKPLKGFEQDEVHGKKLLISSFLLGIFLFMAMTFIPARFEVNREYIRYGFYFIFLLLLIYNATVSIRFYKPESRAMRSIIMTILMIVYFYSGMLGGLMVIAFVALFIVIYAFVKLRKIITIG
jgi:hypothetical protein